MNTKQTDYLVQRKYPDGKKWYLVGTSQKTLVGARIQMRASISMDNEEGYRDVKHRIVKKVTTTTCSVVMVVTTK